MSKAQRVTLTLAVLLIILGLWLKHAEQHSVADDDARLPAAATPPHSSTATATDSQRMLEAREVKSALPLSEDPPPRYPRELVASRIEGSVVVRFVVDTLGHAEMRTLSVIWATNPKFVDAVREVLPKWRFSPAEVYGHKVRQFVQFPVEFRAPTPSH